MKDQPKHTPGPWSADKATYHNGYVEHFVRRDGDAIAIVGDVTDPETRLPSKVNARLIAAAPDLLEALKDALEYIPTTLQGRARAAIAKAEGRGE